MRWFQWLGWLPTMGGYISGSGYLGGFKSPDWQALLHTKEAKEMTLLNIYMKSIVWWELVPSGMDGMKTVITGGAGNFDNRGYVAAAANAGGTLLVAYIPPAHTGNAIEINMPVLKGIIQAQ